MFSCACGSLEDFTKPNTCTKSRECHFVEKKAPAAAGKTSPSLIHVMKFQERHFCRKKGACGSREDFTKPNAYYKTPGALFSPERKAPAAAGKNSPSLMHIIKCGDIILANQQKRSACGSQGDFTKLNKCYKSAGMLFLPKQRKRLRQPGSLHQATIHKWLWLKWHKAFV